jgi:hypothetical protein
LQEAVGASQDASLLVIAGIAGFVPGRRVGEGHTANAANLEGLRAILHYPGYELRAFAEVHGLADDA